MGKRQFFRQWVFVAFRHSIGIGDGAAFLIGVGVPLIRQFIPSLDTVMNELAWQIPLGVFASVIMVRLLFAPYWIYKEKEKEVASLRKKKQELESKLAELEQRNFAVAWVNEEWGLRTASGWRRFWDDEKGGRSLTLKGHISVTTVGTIQVESVSIDMGGKQYASNWESESFYTSEERDADFEIPLDVPRGKRTAKLLAIVDGRPYAGKPFILDLPSYRLSL